MVADLTTRSAPVARHGGFLSHLLQRRLSTGKYVYPGRQAEKRIDITRRGWGELKGGRSGHNTTEVVHTDIYFIHGSFT